MADIVDRKTRSRMMSGIRNRNTRPELLVRSQLHARGLRYRLNVGALPGRPDLVLTRHQSVVLVHGCFWHGHQCSLFRWPGSNRAFWRKKILGNVARDQKNVERLLDLGWSVATIWECSLRGQSPEKVVRTLDRVETWIRKSRVKPACRVFEPGRN